MTSNRMAAGIRRGDARSMGIQAARQQAQQIQNDQVARQNLYQQYYSQRAYGPMPGPSVAGPLPVEQLQSPVPVTGEPSYDEPSYDEPSFLDGQHAWSQGGKVWNAAAKGELFTHGSQLGKALNPGAQKGVQTINQLARTAAHKTPGLGRFVAATGDDAARVAGASSKGLSKVLGPAAFLLEGGLIGKDIYDKTQAGQSFSQAWREQANEHGANTLGLFTDWEGGAHEIYQKPIDVAMHVLSPVGTVQAGTQLVAEVGGGLGDAAKGAWNWASDAEGRNRTAAKAETEQMMADRQKLYKQSRTRSGQRWQIIKQSRRGDKKSYVNTLPSWNYGSGTPSCKLTRPQMKQKAGSSENNTHSVVADITSAMPWLVLKTDLPQKLNNWKPSVTV